MGTEIQVGPSGTKLLPLTVASGHGAGAQDGQSTGGHGAGAQDGQSAGGHGAGAQGGHSAGGHSRAKVSVNISKQATTDAGSGA
jgi:hypothetical protein